MSAEAKPVELSGLAAAIVIATGRGTERIAWGIGAVKALLFLALLEGLVWLSVPAMRRKPARHRRHLIEVLLKALPFMFWLYCNRMSVIHATL